MKVHELLEDLQRVSQRKNPNWTGQEVVRRILKDFKVSGPTQPGDEDTDYGDPPDFRGKVDVENTWAKMTKTGKAAALYHSYGTFPGEGGVIGLPDPTGKTPDAVASAAHEAFHALLQLKYKNFHNEHVVNRLAVRWLQDNYSGKFLHFAINSLRDSRVSYKGNKYDSSRTHLDKERKSLPGKKKAWW